MTRSGDNLERLLFLGAVGVVFWAPLPFGSVEPWAVGILRIAAFGLVILWAVRSALTGALNVSTSPLQLVLYAAVALAFLQTLPILSDGARISVDPFSTRQTALTLLAFALLFSLLLSVLDRRSRIVGVAWALFVFAAALSLFGIVQQLSGTRDIYWFRPSPVETLFGPFVNKNHFAGLMELLLPMGIGFLVTGAVARDRKFLVLFAAVVIGLAVALSRSRGGAAALVAAIVFLVVMALATSRRAQRSRSVSFAVARAVGAVALVGAIGLGVVWLGSDAVVDSFASLPADAAAVDATSRRGIWNATLALAADHPVTGAGLGAYGTAIVAYWPSSEYATLLQAHNDHLQVVADAGIAGAVLGILFAVGLGFYFVKGIHHKDPAMRAVALGAGAGIFGLLIHGLVDFNMQIPSNALMFLLSSALVVRVATTTAGAVTLPEEIVK